MRPPATVGTVGTVGTVALLVGCLAGCGSSVSHLDDVCSDVVTGTAALAPYDPGRPVSALTFALGRFGLLDRAVSAAREAGLPTADATRLRQDWLDPAVASLATWSVRLEALRVAVDARDVAGVSAALDPALAVGTQGVDVAELDRLGLARCATAFTPPVLAIPAPSTG